MTKCLNGCNDAAEQNLTWPTSRGPMSANFCGVCAAEWWARFKNTSAGQGLVIGAAKSQKELAEICDEYADRALHAQPPAIRP